MALRISNTAVEQKIEELAKNFRPRTKKTPLAYDILERAANMSREELSAWLNTDNPNAGATSRARDLQAPASTTTADLQQTG